jgi:hypothetical protein
MSKDKIQHGWGRLNKRVLACPQLAGFQRAARRLGGTTLFLTTYDDMFAHARPLTLDAYLDRAWDAILKSKLEALLVNQQRLWVENLLTVLPFAASELWRLRHESLL